MEPQNALPCSQDPVTGSYNKSFESSLHFLTPFLQDTF